MKNILGFVMLAMAGAAFAAVDIVALKPDSGEPVYILKNTSTGKVLGTFWDPAKGQSDYGFESSVTPEFYWSKNRDYVAVSGGEARSRTIFLYSVSGTSLQEIPVPQLSEKQSEPLSAISDPVADGLDAVGWQPDGTLLLRFWAADRVTSESEKQKEANVWAYLEVSGLTARIAGTRLVKPAPPDAAPPSGKAPGPQNALAQLAGSHVVSGKNPSGTSYRGTVNIRVADGVASLEWNVGSSVSRGKGILVGRTLGVELDSGMAIYHLVGQPEGCSLIGYWSTAGSGSPSPEAILIGNAGTTQADFPAEEINGNYTSLREVQDGQVESSVKLSGGAIAKTAVWSSGKNSSSGMGLALSDGLALLTPSGLSVFTKRGDSFEGQSLSPDGKLGQQSLIPVR